MNAALVIRLVLESLVLLVVVWGVCTALMLWHDPEDLEAIRRGPRK